MQSWWAPKIGSDPTLTYVNHICQVTNNSVGGSYNNSIRASASVPVNTGVSNAIFTGTTVTDTKVNYYFSSKYEVAASSSANAGWSSFYCVNAFELGYAYTDIAKL